MQHTQSLSQSGPQRIPVASSLEESSEKTKEDVQSSKRLDTRFKPLRPSPEAIAALKAAAEEDKAKLSNDRDGEKIRSLEVKIVKGKGKEVDESLGSITSREAKAENIADANILSFASAKPSAAKAMSLSAPTRSKPPATKQSIPAVATTTTSVPTVAKTAKPAPSIEPRKQDMSRPKSVLPSTSTTRADTTASRARAQPIIVKPGLVPRKTKAVVETKPAWGRSLPKKLTRPPIQGMGIKKNSVVPSASSSKSKSNPTSVPLPPSPVPQEAITLPLPPSPPPAEAALELLLKSSQNPNNESVLDEKAISYSPATVKPRGDVDDAVNGNAASSDRSLAQEMELSQYDISERRGSNLILDGLDGEATKASKDSSRAVLSAEEVGPESPSRLSSSPSSLSPDQTLPGSLDNTRTPMSNTPLPSTSPQNPTLISPSTPQNKVQSMSLHSHAMPVVDDILQTPISNLMSTIQRGFLYTPAAPLSPPQSYSAPDSDIHAIFSSKNQRGLGNNTLAPGLESVFKPTQKRPSLENDEDNGMP
jgi:hypothetical protein